MVLVDWLFLTLVPVVTPPAVGHLAAPSPSTSQVVASTAAELSRTAWQLQALNHQHEQLLQGSGGEMPPGSANGTAVVYQSRALLSDPGAAAAELPPAGAPEGPLTLSRSELRKAVFMDDLTIPTPAELFAAIARGQRPKWQEQYRQPGLTGYRNRPQMALNIGIILADAYMAVEARDTMQCLNMTQDLLTLAAGLGMTPSQLARGKVLQSFAQEGRWPVLRSELEAMENEIKTVLKQQRDTSLADILSLGCWLRTLEIASAVLKEGYDPERAAILRQPELLFWLQNRANRLAPRIAKENVIGRMKECLDDISPFLAFDARTPPTQIECEKLNRLLGRFLKRAVDR